jgi:beta-lactamase regulating signal transducer with metallopeptidase domain
MIATIIFAGVCALLVCLTGLGDKARDPRLTVVALGLLAMFPLLVVVVPKVGVLPVVEISGSADPGFNSETSFGNLLFGLWVAGGVVAGLRLAIAACRISRWRRDSRLLAQTDGVELRQHAELGSPVATGVIHKVVFVPGGWAEWSDEARSMVLDHELAHHRRHDPLWRWIAEIARVVHWYNPLVWWITRRLTLQCEFACDAKVLEKGVSPRDYAHMLCRVAEARRFPGPVLAMAQTSALEARIRRLVQPSGHRTAGVGIMIVLAIAGAASLASVERRAQEPVPASDAIDLEAEAQLRWSANPFPGE